MLLSALLFAAVVQAELPPSAPKAPPLAERRIVEGRIIGGARRSCALLKSIPVDQAEIDQAPLGHRRPEGLHYAVMRSVGGCPVPTPMRQNRPAR